MLVLLFKNQTFIIQFNIPWRERVEIILSLLNLRVVYSCQPWQLKYKTRYQNNTTGNIAEKVQYDRPDGCSLEQELLLTVIWHFDNLSITVNS